MQERQSPFRRENFKYSRLLHRSEDAKMVSNLLTRYTSEAGIDDALTEAQAHQLQKGVRAAIENEDDRVLGLPSKALTNDRWTHAGIGVSVWLHKASGVVILTHSLDSEPIVTDVGFLDNVSAALARFHGKTGGIARINDEHPDIEGTPARGDD